MVSPAIMVPICPNCHHIFEHFEAYPIFEVDKVSGRTRKNFVTSPNRCPKCGREIHGVKYKFPDENGEIGLVFNIDELYD